jgi:hypothetical protein
MFANYLVGGCGRSDMGKLIHVKVCVIGGQYCIAQRIALDNYARVQNANSSNIPCSARQLLAWRLPARRPSTPRLTRRCASINCEISRYTCVSEAAFQLEIMSRLLRRMAWTRVGQGDCERQPICQRRTNHARICSGSAASLVHRQACALSLPCGSRTSTQRNGRTGRPLLQQWPCR